MIFPKPSRDVSRFVPLTIGLVLLAGCPVAEPNSLVATSASGTNDSAVPRPGELLQRIDRALKQNLSNRQLATEVNGAWQILHGILAYGNDLSIATPAGQKPAVEYLLAGGSINGFTLRSGDRFEPIDAARSSDDPVLTRGVRAEMDPGEKRGQGHRDQWLAYLAACKLAPDQVVQTTDGPRRVELWLRQIEWDIPLNFEQEFSWTLMALVPYRPSTHRWKARDGKSYSIESLLRSELDSLSPSSACGGSHRLVGIAVTLNKRKAEGAELDGVWADAQSLIELAMEQAVEFQNADGSFSSNYFDRPGWSIDLATSIGTTGHTLEFVAVAAPDEVLLDKRVIRGANTLCDLLEETASLDLECGALYHALSGLRIYRDRIKPLLTTES